MRANQFRVILSVAAYVLLETIRRVCLRGTEFARAQVSTMRLKLPKIGAVSRSGKRGGATSISVTIRRILRLLPPAIRPTALGKKNCCSSAKHKLEVEAQSSTPSSSVAAGVASTRSLISGTCLPSCPH